MKLVTSLVVLGLACATLAAPTVDSSLLRSLQTKGHTEILISFKNSDVKNIRTKAVSQTRSLGGSPTAVRQSIFDALTAHADATQAKVLDVLNKHRTASQKVMPLWITNQVAVKGATLKTLELINKMEEISEIIETPMGGLIEPVEFQELPENFVNAGETYGVIKVQAPELWAQGNKGAGVLVGSLDTGVRPSHIALRDHYRADHGWYDPAEDDLTATDLHGHGTHTIGTMVGSTNGIGVAPEAQFISCKGMNRYGSGSAADFIACGQFFVCPHLPSGPRDDPRCDLAPVAVGNSWGFIGNNGFFDDVVEAWIAADIAPIFAAGNEGQGCSTLRTPGNAAKSITIGATDDGDNMAYFSSAGPSHEGVRKPTVSAPGVNTISCGISSDTSYATMSGTSMATPHVVGVTALLNNKKPNLTVSQLEAALIAGTQPTVPTGKTCGGIVDTTYPNNHVGHGRVNALLSANSL